MMFNDIPSLIAERMLFLETMDRRDRVSGVSKEKRLRQVPRETGQFLCLMLSMCPPGDVVEIGTSAGYSALWLAVACKKQGRKITTFETDVDKVVMAKVTFEVSGIDDIVKAVHGDALECLVG